MTRQANLAKIHIAKKDLNLSEETYRTILQTQGGADSSAKLNLAGQLKVINYIKGTYNYKFTNKKNNWRLPLIIKINALWYTLHDAKKVNSRAKKSINDWVHRMTDKTPLKANKNELGQCIESLKQWCDREGVEHD